MRSYTRKSALEEVQSDLASQGFCMVECTTREEADSILCGMWDWLEGLGRGIRRHDPATHRRWPQHNRGVLGMYGIGQSDFMWRARTLPGVIDAFATVWGESDLVVSFDGANMMLPGRPEVPSLWPHRDQQPGTGFLCVQGALHLTDNLGDHDAGLVVWPGSHLFDWTMEDPTWQERTHGHFYLPPAGRFTEENAVVLRADAGTLCLWDSRLIHCNVAQCSAEAPLRSVAYICMVPRRRVTLREQLQRICLFETWCTTTHWPMLPIPNHETEDACIVLDNLRCAFRSTTMPDDLLHRASALL